MAKLIKPEVQKKGFEYFDWNVDSEAPVVHFR
jgi:hypothetical protein